MTTELRRQITKSKNRGLYLNLYQESKTGFKTYKRFWKNGGFYFVFYPSSSLLYKYMRRCLRWKENI